MAVVAVDVVMEVEVEVDADVAAAVAAATKPIPRQPRIPKGPQFSEALFIVRAGLLFPPMSHPIPAQLWLGND